MSAVHTSGTPLEPATGCRCGLTEQPLVEAVAAGTLTPSLQHLIELAYLHGHNQQEIARQLDLRSAR